MENTYESKGNIVLFNNGGNDKVFYYNSSTGKTGKTLSSNLTSEKYVGYAYNEKVPVCRSNANSLAVLISVNTEDGNGGHNYYMYFPSDLDNNGFNVTGKTVGDTKVYGTGASYMINSKTYSDSKYLHKKSSTQSIADMNSNAPNVEVPAEYNTAKAVANYIKGKGDSVDDIFLYQQSHHGQNNSPEAIKILNLNRSNVYAVAPTQHKIPSTGVDYYDRYRSSVVLGDATKMILKKKTTSDTEKYGVHCEIWNNGARGCSQY